MTRRRKIVAAVLALGVLATAAAAAQAAFQGRLHASASVNALAITWESPGSTGTNDEGSANDPAVAGMSPTREAYNVGSANASATPDTLSITVNGAYPGYRFTVSDLAKMTGGGAAAFKVQGVSVSGVPVGATITAGLDPTLCGSPLTGTASPVTFEVRVVDVPAGASFTMTVDVQIAPAAAYSAAACNAWS